MTLYILGFSYLDGKLYKVGLCTYVLFVAPSSAAPSDFKEPPVFVKELVDMEANDGDRVELVVQVEGQYPWQHVKVVLSAEVVCLCLLSFVVC